MSRRQVAIEIFSPTEGIHRELPSSMITARSTPSCTADSYYGAVQKDYGTTLFATGTLGAPSNLIFEADFPAQTVLEVFTHTNMKSYSAGTYANDGQTYTGTFTDYWNACMHNAVMVYGNGKDLVQYKPAYNSTGTQMGGVSSGSYMALGFVSFKDHLNLYHTTEGGTACPKRVRWTKVGLLSYATADWGTGTAGFLDLQDMDGNLLAAGKLGNGAVAIYAENSVHIQEWVGGNDVYRFTKVLSNLDIPTRRCFVANDSVHYLLTRDGVYEYAGGRDIKCISDPIESDFVGVINSSNMSRAFMQFRKHDNELRVYVPTGTSTNPDTCYICKVKDNYSWFRGPGEYTAAGQSQRPSAVTIGDLVGAIGAQNWTFGEMAVKAGAVTPLLADPSGRVVQADKTVYSLSATGATIPQTFIFDTKDISSIKDIDPLIQKRYNLTEYMDNQSRWLQCQVEAKGYGSLYLQYSLDEGNSWTGFDESPKTLTSNWDMYYFDVDRVSPKLRIRLSNTATNEVVHCRYVKVEFVPGVNL